MIKIDEDKNIQINRGDATGTLQTLPITYEDYEFQVGDVLTLNVYRKKGYTEPKVFTKDIEVQESGTTAYFVLTEEDTTTFEKTNKRTIYWYEIVLNDTNTIIGYDEDGAKEFVVYPGGIDE